MNHISYENWLNYINDTVDEILKKEYEDHLYSCDACLEVYMKALEAEETHLPDFTEQDQFTDAVMAKVNMSIRMDKRKPKNSRRQTLIHYGLAAGLTIFLMSSGVFSQLIGFTNTLEEKENRETTSYVQAFLMKQESITEKLDQNLKEGHQK